MGGNHLLGSACHSGDRSGYRLHLCAPHFRGRPSQRLARPAAPRLLRWPCLFPLPTICLCQPLSALSFCGGCSVIAVLYWALSGCSLSLYWPFWRLWLRGTIPIFRIWETGVSHQFGTPGFSTILMLPGTTHSARTG